MKMYVVSKEKGGQYYCHLQGFPYVPVFGSFGTKKHALKCAADSMVLPLKEYMRLRNREKAAQYEVNGYGG